jgi:hypothetical protein
VGPADQQEGRHGASAGGRVGDGPRGPSGEWACCREREGWAGCGPAGGGEDFPFLFSISISFLFLLNKKNLSIFSWVSKIFYVRCYLQPWCMHMMNEMSYEVGGILGDYQGGFRSFRVSNLGFKIGMLQIYPT